MTSAAASSTLEPVERRSPRFWRPQGRLQVQAAIALLTFASYISGRLLDGPASTVFSAIGVSACGCAWLFTRALFDPAQREARWVYVVAVLLATTGAFSIVLPASSLVDRLAANTYALSGSAALLMIFVEPFHRYASGLSRAEKCFRLLFVISQAALVAVSVLGLRAADDDRAKVVCALLGVATIVVAVWFRWRHPLPAPPARSARRAPTADDMRLADRLGRLVVEERLESQPELRIADVAARLREPEYRVSQCVTAVLGFPNFNRWINHHRIARARQLLEQPHEGRSILEIAFACGFASLGPFNRAFRDQVGTTPRHYRAARRAAAQDLSGSPRVVDHQDVW